MGRFDRSGGFNKGRSFGGGRGGFNDRPRPQLFKTMCSKCGKDCEVPFRPSGEKPVFCRDCFRENGGADARRSEERSFQRPQQDAKPAVSVEQFNALSAKVDKILHILESAVSKQEEAPVEEVVVEKKKRASKKAL